jgi:hypothetical protein
MNSSLKINGALQKGSVYFFIQMFKTAVLKGFLVLTFLIVNNIDVYSQTNYEADTDKTDNAVVSTSSSTNFDGRMLAGLNGDSMFSLSMTQGLKNFAYQLNSKVSNNNDFEDYNNSSFMTNETGFTGELSLLDYWKIIPEFEISNTSYGMFDNSYYDRENNDKIRLRLKNEYKPVPARWDFDLNYARYDHVLKLTETSTSAEIDDTFHSMKGIIGMEYIWSASNKIGIRSENGLNKYPEEYEDDSYSYNEFYASFKFTEYTMLTLTPMLCWNNDGSDYFYFKGNISSINLKYLSLELLHEYKLSSYKPEEVMYSQKFMSSVYDLPPATINHTELKSELEAETGTRSDVLLGVKRAGLKLKGIYEDNDNFYNYYPMAENILSAEAVPVNYFNGRAEFVTTIVLFTQVIDMEFAYDYYRYIPQKPYEDIKITYRPENIFTCNLSYEGSWLEINWANSYRDRVYINPSEDRKLESSVIGTLDIHIKLYDTFYLHSRIINLYNEEYVLREGYPEPGVQFFTGLRIII